MHDVIIRYFKDVVFHSACETTYLVIVVWHALCLPIEMKSFITPHTDESKHAHIQYIQPSPQALFECVTCRCHVWKQIICR